MIMLKSSVISIILGSLAIYLMCVRRIGRVLKVSLIFSGNALEERLASWTSSKRLCLRDSFMFCYSGSSR